MITTKLAMINLESVSREIEKQGAAGMEVAADALNATIDYARKIGGDAILDQVLFPPGYLDLDGRFAITERATVGNPRAAVLARQRTTSLARFVTSAPPPLKKGVVAVRVKRGGGGSLRAYMAPLKSGNVGVALRVKAGESLAGRTGGTAGLPVLREDKWGTVYLLSGPSVNQVFYNVADDIDDKVESHLVDQFVTLYEKRFG